jgi:hypothetical protein
MQPMKSASKSELPAPRNADGLGLPLCARIPASVLIAILLSIAVPIARAGSVQEMALPVPIEAGLGGMIASDEFAYLDLSGNDVAAQNNKSVVSLPRRTREKKEVATAPVIVVDNDTLDTQNGNIVFGREALATVKERTIENAPADNKASMAIDLGPTPHLRDQPYRTENFAGTSQEHAEGDHNMNDSLPARKLQQEQLPAVPLPSVKPDVSDQLPKDDRPIVVYENGQLTITAENVPLSEIMSALHSLMGAEVDLPVGASDERVWAHLGPGPARKILSDLLANTDLDYIIQGSAHDSNGIHSVTLTIRTDVAPGKPGISSESAGRVDDRRPSGQSSVAKEENLREEPPAVTAEIGRAHV